MIPVGNIRNIINELSSKFGVTIIRADQQGAHPDYPYATYKEIVTNIESPHQDIREVVENALDPTDVDIKKYEKNESSISFNFLDKNRVDRIRTHAGNSFAWFKSIAGMEFCKTNEITPRMISTAIEDRTVYQEAFFENKIGFDVRFDYTGLNIETIEAIDEVNIGVTVDEIAQPDIEINLT